MPDSALIIPLVSAGTAGVFCVLFICGLIFPRSVVADKDRRIAELEAALEAERDAARVAVAAAAATRDVMTALQLGQQLGHQLGHGEHT